MNKLNRFLNSNRAGSFGPKDIDWKKIGRKLRQIVAIIPRLIALPFFLVGVTLVVVAIVPANIAEFIQKLADKVER